MDIKQPADKLLSAVFTSLITELILITIIMLAIEHFAAARFALIAWIIAVLINNIYFVVKLAKYKPARYFLYIILLLLPVVFILASGFYLLYSFQGVTC